MLELSCGTPPVLVLDMSPDDAPPSLQDVPPTVDARDVEPASDEEPSVGSVGEDGLSVGSVEVELMPGAELAPAVDSLCADVWLVDPPSSSSNAEIGGASKHPGRMKDNKKSRRTLR